MGKNKFINIFFVFIFLFIAWNFVETQEISLFSGIIAEDTIWDGVIRVEDDLLVPDGVVLTIKPGTKIIIKEKDSSKNEPLFLSPYNEILVRGKIIAEGEKDKPIIFSSEGKSTDGIFWAGIILDKSGACIFRFCDIKNAFTGIDSLESSPIIEENIIENNKYAVISSGESSYPKIIKNIIRKNYAGIYSIFSSRGEVTENKIEDNEEEGMFVGANSNIILKNNIINHNKYDIRQE